MKDRLRRVPSLLVCPSISSWTRLRVLDLRIFECVFFQILCEETSYLNSYGSVADDGRRGGAILFELSSLSSGVSESSSFSCSYEMLEVVISSPGIVSISPVLILNICFQFVFWNVSLPKRLLMASRWALAAKTTMTTKRSSSFRIDTDSIMGDGN